MPTADKKPATRETFFQVKKPSDLAPVQEAQFIVEMYLKLQLIRVRYQSPDNSTEQGKYCL